MTGAGALVSLSVPSSSLLLRVVVLFASFVFSDAFKALLAALFLSGVCVCV